MRALISGMAMVGFLFLGGCQLVAGLEESSVRDGGDEPTIDAAVAQHGLAVTVVGNGVVTSEPAGIDCGDDCSASLDEGATITLTATAADGFAFAEWSGEGCSGSAPTCTLTMTQARSVTATFKPGHTLTVTRSGAGTVTSEPASIDCGELCIHGYDEGTGVTLTAAPTALAIFRGWSGDTGGCAVEGLSCTVTMDRARTVAASFAARYRLTVRAQGNGAVTAKVGTSVSFTCPANQTCTHDYEEGTSVVLEGTAATGSAFREWTGACSGTAPCTVVMIEDRAVEAGFPRLLTLSVTNAGTGTGQVTIKIAGQGDVTCGRGTCTGSYMEGTSITLVATGPIYGSSFVSWSGACGGSNTTCSFPIVQMTSVTATFREEYDAIAVATLGSGTRGSGYVRVTSGGVTVGTCTTAQGQCNFRVTPGQVLFTAVAEGCATFTCWSGLLEGCFSTTNPNVRTVPAQSAQAIAVFAGCQ